MTARESIFRAFIIVVFVVFIIIDWMVAMESYRRDNIKNLILFSTYFLMNMIGLGVVTILFNL